MTNFFCLKYYPREIKFALGFKSISQGNMLDKRIHFFIFYLHALQVVKNKCIVNSHFLVKFYSRCLCGKRLCRSNFLEKKKSYSLRQEGLVRVYTSVVFFCFNSFSARPAINERKLKKAVVFAYLKTGIS